MERARLGVAELEDVDMNVKSASIPSDSQGQQSCSIPPSPGLSNYDALDLEGDPYDDEDLYDTGEDLINSDFNKREPVELPPSELELPPFPRSKSATVPQMPSSTYIMGLIDEEEVQKEISFAQFDSAPAAVKPKIEPLYFF